MKGTVKNTSLTNDTFGLLVISVHDNMMEPGGTPGGDQNPIPTPGGDQNPTPGGDQPVNSIKSSQRDNQ